MPIKAFLMFLIARLKGFSKSNALGLFFGLSGGALLYWLDVHQYVDLFKFASLITGILCALGIECISHTADAVAERAATVNTFIGVTSLGISWLATEVYEAIAPSCPRLQQWEKKAEELQEKLTGQDKQNTNQLDLFK